MYFGREFLVGDVFSCEARVEIPGCPLCPQWGPWVVHSEGTLLRDAWDHTALAALTRFCEDYPALATYSFATVFPVRGLSEEALRRIGRVMDVAVPGFSPAVPASVRYSVELLRLHDSVRRDLVVLRHQLMLANTREHQHVLQLQEAQEQIQDFVQQLATRDELVAFLEDALSDAWEQVFQLQHQDEPPAPVPVVPLAPSPVVSSVQSRVGPLQLELSDVESSVGEVAPPVAPVAEPGRSVVLVSQPHLARFQEELRRRGIEVDRAFVYQPPRE